MRECGSTVGHTSRHGTSWPAEHDFNSGLAVMNGLLSDWECRKHKKEPGSGSQMSTFIRY